MDIPMRLQLQPRDLPVDILRDDRRPGSPARMRALAMNSAASAWLAKLMSITAAGCPSAAARLTRRPSPRRRPGARLDRCTRRRTPVSCAWRRLPASRAAMLISSLKWPELADDCAVLQGRQVLGVDARSRRPWWSRRCPDGRRLGHRHDAVSVHQRLKGPDGVHLGD